jgi:hypothetical protein
MPASHLSGRPKDAPDHLLIEFVNEPPSGLEIIPSMEHHVGFLAREGSQKGGGEM